MMEEIPSITYKRAIVPPDAVSLAISTIDFGDASKHTSSALQSMQNSKRKQDTHVNWYLQGQDWYLMI